jgi:CRISPR type I-E-associated protein CasB/Cse2
MSEMRMTPIEGLLKEIQQAAAPGHGDRGKLAALRRGFSEVSAHYAWPHIAPWCDITDERQRIIWLCVAAAAATLQPHGLVRTGVGNMGATLRRLALGEGGQKADKALNSFEARFRRLLTCPTTDDLCRHLPRVIRAAAANDRPVDARMLFFDLQDWENREKRDVRVEWARGYWVGEHHQKKEEVAACDA